MVAAQMVGIVGQTALSDSRRGFDGEDEPGDGGLG